MTKISWAVVVAGLVLGPTGCVQTQVTKAVHVHKDATGQITGYTEIESATQVGQALVRFQFQHLKSAPGDAEPLKLE
jgi:hypothetical protein